MTKTERALERLADRIRSTAEYPDRAVLYQDIEYLRSRLAEGSPKAEPCPGNLNCPVCLALERADDGKEKT